MYKILSIIIIILLCNCCDYLWVSDISYIEPVYNINQSQIIHIDTIENSSGNLFKIKYKLK
jgi:hypothetical protein